jgi:hypothetical protein
MKKKHKLTDEQFYTLDSVGVVIGRNIISKRDLIKINSLIDTHLENSRPGKFPIMEIDETFFDLMTLPWVLNVCKEILGPHFRFDHSFGLQQPGEGEGPNLHGGPLSSQGCNYYLSNSGTIRCGRVSVGISLTYQGPETGGFAYIPGSHKSSFNLSGIQIFRELLNSEFNHDCVSIPTLNPGDVCVFVDGLVHGTSNWKLTSIRRSLYYMYSPGFVAWRPHNQIEKYIPKAITDIQKALLLPPYVAEFDDTERKLGNNVWRKEI